MSEACTIQTRITINSEVGDCVEFSTAEGIFNSSSDEDILDAFDIQHEQAVENLKLFLRRRRDRLEESKTAAVCEDAK